MKPLLSLFFLFFYTFSYSQATVDVQSLQNCNCCQSEMPLNSLTSKMNKTDLLFIKENNEETISRNYTKKEILELIEKSGNAAPVNYTKKRLVSVIKKRIEDLE